MSDEKIKDGIDIIDDINCHHIHQRIFSYFGYSSFLEPMVNMLHGFFDRTSKLPMHKRRKMYDGEARGDRFFVVEDERTEQRYKVTISVKVEPHDE